MTDNKDLTPIQRILGDFSPKMVSLTDDVLFGDIWAREELSPRDRSLITISALVTNGSTQQLTSHLRLGLKNGLTETEIKEAFIHLAFYTGWPRALSAFGVAQQVFGESGE